MRVATAWFTTRSAPRPYDAITRSRDRTHSEQTQGNAGSAIVDERVCAEAQNNHGQDELDEAQGDEAFWVVGYMLATGRAVRRVFAAVHRAVHDFCEGELISNVCDCSMRQPPGQRRAETDAGFALEVPWGTKPFVYVHLAWAFSTVYNLNTIARAPAPGSHPPVSLSMHYRIA